MSGADREAAGERRDGIGRARERGPGTAGAARCSTAPSRSASTSVSATRPAAEPEWSVSRTAAPASRRSATRAASQMRPSSSRPENGSSSRSSGHPACSASSSATRWSIPRLSVAAGRSRTAGSRPLAAAAVAQSVVVSPRSARIARSHSSQRNAGARRTFSGTKAHAAWRTSDPARGAARPARTRRRLVLPLPLAPATWTAAPRADGQGDAGQHRAPPAPDRERPRLEQHRHGSQPSARPRTSVPRLAQPPGRPVRHRGMPLRRIPLALVLAAALLGAGASVAAADPPWSPPSALPGAGSGPRPRPRGVTSRRSRRPTAPSRRARPPNWSGSTPRPGPSCRAPGSTSATRWSRPTRRTRSRLRGRPSGRRGRSTTRAAYGPGRPPAPPARPSCARCRTRRART